MAIDFWTQSHDLHRTTPLPKSIDPILVQLNFYNEYTAANIHLKTPYGWEIELWYSQTISLLRWMIDVPQVKKLNTQLQLWICHWWEGRFLMIVRKWSRSVFLFLISNYTFTLIFSYRRFKIHLSEENDHTLIFWIDHHLRDDPMIGSSLWVN